MGEELENELARSVAELREGQWRPGELLDVLASVVDLVEYERTRARGGWRSIDLELRAVETKRVETRAGWVKLQWGPDVVGWAPIARVLEALDNVLEDRPDDAGELADEWFFNELHGEFRPDHPEEVTE